MLDLMQRYAVGAQLIHGMAEPCNQSMYDAICTTIGELWGQVGYGYIYESVKVTVVDGRPMYCLPDPSAVHSKLVDLMRFGLI